MRCAQAWLDDKSEARRARREARRLKREAEQREKKGSTPDVMTERSIVAVSSRAKPQKKAAVGRTGALSRNSTKDSKSK